MISIKVTDVEGNVIIHHDEDGDTSATQIIQALANMIYSINEGSLMPIGLDPWFGNISLNLQMTAYPQQLNRTQRTTGE